MRHIPPVLTTVVGYYFSTITHPVLAYEESPMSLKEVDFDIVHEKWNDKIKFRSPNTCQDVDANKLGSENKLSITLDILAKDEVKCVKVWSRAFDNLVFYYDVPPPVGAAVAHSCEVAKNPHSEREEMRLAIPFPNEKGVNSFGTDDELPEGFAFLTAIAYDGKERVIGAADTVFSYGKGDQADKAVATGMRVDVLDSDNKKTISEHLKKMRTEREQDLLDYETKSVDYEPGAGTIAGILSDPASVQAALKEHIKALESKNRENQDYLPELFDYQVLNERRLRDGDIYRINNVLPEDLREALVSEIKYQVEEKKAVHKKYEDTNRSALKWHETPISEKFLNVLAGKVVLPLAQKLFPEMGLFPNEAVVYGPKLDSSENPNKFEDTAVEDQRRVFAYSFHYGDYVDEKAAETDVARINYNDERFNWHLDGGEVVFNLNLERTDVETDSDIGGELVFWQGKDGDKHLHVPLKVNSAVMFQGHRRHSSEMNTRNAKQQEMDLKSDGSRSGTRTNLIIRLTSAHVRRSPAERYAAECVDNWETRWMKRGFSSFGNDEEL